MFFIHFSKRPLMPKYLLTSWLEEHVNPNGTECGNKNKKLSDESFCDFEGY